MSYGFSKYRKTKYLYFKLDRLTGMELSAGIGEVKSSNRTGFLQGISKDDFRLEQALRECPGKVPIESENDPHNVPEIFGKTR